MQWEKARIDRSRLQDDTLFRLKDEIDGSMGRLGVQGSRQKGVFDSPRVKTTTLQSVLNTVASENLHLQRVDVKRLSLFGDSSDVNIGEAQSECALTGCNTPKIQPFLKLLKMFTNLVPKWPFTKQVSKTYFQSGVNNYNIK